YVLQTRDVKEIQVQVKRGKEVLPDLITLKAEEDRTWPLEDRGMLLQPDWRLQKAANLGDALGMGMHRTVSFIKQLYGQLVSIVTGRVSAKTLGGPIIITKVAYQIAGSDFFEFLLFLGIISVNLAVINFLPIPVLDGGHMVFLIYEKIRGRPASEQMRAAATYLGLALILSLMAFVIYLDVKRIL
ncbi:MAG: site-2 protease family protein, partial [Planctomycetes bacterium]|nr:site-2 protease family protein [Planctomycetota bacterium]